MCVFMQSFLFDRASKVLFLNDMCFWTFYFKIFPINFMAILREISRNVFFLILKKQNQERGKNAN